ncbi:aminoglycoside phosphotransferase family protein [Kribbella sp. NPDC026611]|uniref:phosphotransferase family protein n=1 Tax=Kribbella sp. NPDC026611 TaxID=3154911 RepID=UPI0033E582A2
MRTPGPLTRSLLATGLVTAADIHTHGIRAVDTSRSHDVVIVEVGDGRGYVVKQADHADDDTQGSPARERAIYRLATRHPELAALAPLPRHIDNDILVLDYRAATRTVAEVAVDNGWYDGTLAAALGRTIATWHRASRPYVDEVPAAGAPWIYRALDPERPAYTRTNVGVARLLARLEVGPLVDWLPEQADLWRTDTVIHGDLRFDNCLAGPDGQISFIDWECTTQGDPAWDLGALIAELLSLSPATDAKSCAPILTGPARLLLKAYAETTPARPAPAPPAPAPPVPAERVPAERVFDAAAARLLLRAVQLAGRGDPTLDAELDRHLALTMALAFDSSVRP